MTGMSPRAIFATDLAKGWRPWGIFVPVLGLIFVAMTVASFTALLQHAHLVDAAENPIGLQGFAAFLLLPFAALGLAVLAWVRFVERRSLSTLGLVNRGRLQTFLLGHITGAAMATAIVAAIWIAGSFAARGYAPAFHSPAGLGSIVILLACFAVQSSVEEILFRGWMLSAIATKFGTVPAIAISSAAFTLMHYDPGVSAIFVTNVFLFAVFACCWAIAVGNIWGVMGFHSGWNWLLATGFELRVTGLDAHLPALLVKLVPRGPDYLTGGVQGPEGSVLCSVVLLGGIVFLGLRRQRERRARG